MSQRRRSAPAGKVQAGHAPIFAALGDEVRLRLIGALCAGGAMSITQLTAGTDITRQAITKHLVVWCGTSTSGVNGCGNSSRLAWMRRAARWSRSPVNGIMRSAG